MSQTEDPIRRRIVAQAELIRSQHTRCTGLTSPCKEDCPCWFEAIDAEADRVMTMTDEQVRAEMITDGFDPDDEAARAKRVIAKTLGDHFTGEY